MTNTIIKISNLELINGCVKDISSVYAAMGKLIQSSKVLSRNPTLFVN